MTATRLYHDSFWSQHFYEREDILSRMTNNRLKAEIVEKRSSVLEFLKRGVWADALSLFTQLKEVTSSGFSVRDNTVVAGETLAPHHQQICRQLIERIIPWRKGPWRLGNCDIDSEWRSDIKYRSLSPILPEIKGKNVLDIGSGNGYYGARLLADEAATVLCLDPSEIQFLQFELFQLLAKEERIQLEMLGFADAPHLRAKFDVTFCMGVLYHHHNPYQVVQSCRDSLVKGGLLVLESMIYPGEDSVLFFPPDRYAKARNVHFLPTKQALFSLCQRAGFQQIEVLNEAKTTVEEQRRTKFAPDESLAEFLDPNDDSKTIEGHPAPRRAIIIARR